MKFVTIQFRIAAWYLISSSAILAAFAIGSWVAMRASMYHSIDRDLNYRLVQVIPYVQTHALNTEQQFQKDFGGGSDSPVVGVFVQFTDDNSRVLFESDVLRAHKLSASKPAPSDGSVLTSIAGGNSGWPVRVASKRIVVSGVPLSVHLMEPLRDMFGALREYTFDLCVLLVGGSLFAALGGYLLSRRALAPVERVRQEAEAISPNSLDSRLRVPRPNDELKRLTQTLNAMLSRIESGFLAVQQFTADASHELRAPLALILTSSEISLRRERSREELQETLRKVLRAARHMSKLVDQLLTLARNDIACDEADPEIVDIVLLAQDLCDEFSPVAVEKGLTLDCTACDGETLVKTYETDMRRLLLILLDNAVKYTESGSISIKIERDADDVRISVSDTGIGIDAEALPHIFDRFWRADQARSRGSGGTGLGLSIAIQIVAKRNGTIVVKSQPGQGSSFLVTLPQVACFHGTPGQAG